MAEDEGEEGDDDSALRLDKAALKKFMKLGKSRSLTFAFVPASGQEEPLFTIHRRKKPDTLGKTARKEAEQTKVAYGRLTVEGKVLTLACDKVVPGMEKKLAKMLRKEKVQMEVKVAEAGPGGSGDTGAA
jgi:hypothetical protein